MNSPTACTATPSNTGIPTIPSRIPVEEPRCQDWFDENMTHPYRKTRPRLGRDDLRCTSSKTKATVLY